MTFEKALWITEYNLNADQMEKHNVLFKLEMIESKNSSILGMSSAIKEKWAI